MAAQGEPMCVPLLQAVPVGAEGDEPRRWPTTPGGAASTVGQRAAAEAAVADLLTWPGDSRQGRRRWLPGRARAERQPLNGGSLSWFYLPFTDLGRDKGFDWSWEAQVQRGNGRSSSPRSEIAGGATLSEALQELVPARQQLPLGESAASLWSAAARTLQQQWAGWSDLLQQATDVAARGPASPEEPSQAGFDMDVRWDDRGSPPGWAWTVSVSVVDTAGTDIGMRDWQGASPAEALRAALTDAKHWYGPVPAFGSEQYEGWA